MRANILMSMALAIALPLASPLAAQPATTPEAADVPVDPAVFQPVDVFDLEFAADPQISPDGRSIAYVRRSFDRMTDTARSNIWTVDVSSGAHRPILSGTASYSSPRWSPDGKRLAYVTGADRDPQIFVRWMDSGQTARLTELASAPQGLAWAPGGDRLAFTMFVKDKPEPFAKLPTAPEGATWAEPPTVIDDIFYRGDGQGYFEQGTNHLFTVSADGGTARQLTRGDFDHQGAPSWSPDGETLYIATDRNPDWRRGESFTDAYAVRVADGSLTRLTETGGPVFAPQVSPDGRRIAFLGNVDNLKSWQGFGLWAMDLRGGAPRELAAAQDNGFNGFEWQPNSRALIAQYDREGDTILARVSTDGGLRDLADGLGGQSLGRPYSGASISVADQSGTIAFNVTGPTRPADVAVLRSGRVRQLTRLNDDLAGIKRFADAEEIWTTAPDGTRSQSWIVKPPNFDPSRKYPLILEIHGGPHTNYGARFSAEVQAYASAGYVVLYSNPRGSTSYGAPFALAIDKAYPGGDYDDLMAAVDGTIAKGYVDPERLFVTGGSGGGVLTSWIVGKTDRFRAAVVAKPVINWTSFVLTADAVPYFAKYWFGTKPWEDQAEYWRRSPLSLVGNVETPTMLLTGEDDYRTPISETEQYYAALQLEDVDTAMVRIKGAGHSIAAKPSNLMNKIAYILAWFEKYDQPDSAPIS